MKKFFFLFIAALAAVSTGAQTTIDGIRYNLNDEDGTAEVDKFNYYVTGDLTGALIIPETVEYGGKAYRVTSLAAQAFGNGYFQSVVIPNSVTKIASGAFFECKKLQSVRLPENLATIEPMVFYNCESLATIEFLKNLRSIKSEAFIGCQSLTSIFIPKNVSEIGGQPTEPAFWLVVDGHPFKGCLNISSIAVDEENATFDSRDGCNAIIETATNTLLYGCEATSIPGSVTALGAGAFRSCTFSSFTIPENITAIGNECFRFCNNLKEIIIPENVEYIGEDVFLECRGLTTAKVEAKVERLSTGTFRGCSSLTDVTLPDNMKKIGGRAFEKCESLTSIDFLPDNLETIEANAFADCKSLTSIDLPDNLNIIEGGAFKGCGLTNIDFWPENIKTIGGETFSYCGSLTTISLPNGLTTVGSCAFGHCNSLTSIYLPGSLTNIEPDAFGYCPNLENVEIGDGLKTINGFRESGLKHIDIPSCVESIGYWAFRGCTNLTEVTLHDGLQRICDRAFAETSNYTDVVLPSTVNYIERAAFEGWNDKTVTCYAVEVPSVDEMEVHDTAYDPKRGFITLSTTHIEKCNPFWNMMYLRPFATTLTVPDEALEEYARTDPWNTFATIKGFSGKTIDPQGINAAEKARDAREVSRYAVDGGRLTSPQKGVNIIRMSDGTVRKVME